MENVRITNFYIIFAISLVNYGTNYVKHCGLVWFDLKKICTKILFNEAIIF